MSLSVNILRPAGMVLGLGLLWSAYKLRLLTQRFNCSLADALRMVALQVKAALLYV